MRGYTFPNEFTDLLIKATGGFLRPEELDALLDSFGREAARYYFTHGSYANLTRIVNALIDPVSFLSEALRYPHHLEMIVAIAANSNFLTDIIVRNPGYMYQLFDNEYMARPVILEDIRKEAAESAGRYRSFAARTNFLRLFKRRYLLKTGARDILGYIDLKTATEEISALAVTVNGLLFELCVAEIKIKYGIENLPFEYTLCSLGKLGGNELNYSSDVDFILFYDRNGDIEGSSKNHFDILSEAAFLFIQTSTEVTPKGFLYRVDFRLRPDGRNSPLCRTLADYTRYYETRGEDWERQMLIKLGFVSGSMELYDRFRSYIDSFIYPASFSVSPMEQVACMKANIEKRNDSRSNIKLFEGGIRDIEFSVQALQLLNGGKLPEVRSGNTLDAIAKLNGKNLLSEQEAALYKDAYIFYRRVEHYLQLMNDTQTHVIPGEGEMAEKLGVFLGFGNSINFLNKLADFRKRVRTVYNSIIGEGLSKADGNPFDSIPFSDRKRAEKNIGFLKSGIDLTGQKKFDSRTISLFSKIEPHLYDHLLSCSFPDKTLDNFARIISGVTFQSIWYREFENKNFFFLFLRLCEYSQKAADILVTDRASGELYITRRVYSTDYDVLYKTLSPAQILFTLTCQFSAGLIDHSEFSIILRNYLNLKLAAIIENETINENYFVAGLGSFGSGEMNFGSDIDLIAAVKDADDMGAVQKKFQGLISRVKKELAPFEADFRLRPEGRTSPVVFGMEYFGEYLGERLQVWEFHAIGKICFVAGSRELYENFCDMVNRAYREKDKKAVAGNTAAMYKKSVRQGLGPGSNFDIKRGSGGIITIEYILDMAGILSNNDIVNPDSPGNENSVLNKIERLSKFVPEPEKLAESYSFLKTLMLAVQNILNVNKTVLPGSRDKKYEIARFLGLKDEKELDNKLSYYRSFNTRMFKQITEKTK